MTRHPRRDSLLTPKWPEHLPTHCGKCSNFYDPGFSLEIGPGKIGRALRRLAPWLTILVIALHAFTNLSFLSFGGRGGAMALAVSIILPSILLHILGGLLPTKARLYCYKCDTSTYHAPPTKADNRIPTVSE